MLGNRILLRCCALCVLTRAVRAASEGIRTCAWTGLDWSARHSRIPLPCGATDRACCWQREASWRPLEVPRPRLSQMWVFSYLAHPMKERQTIGRQEETSQLFPADERDEQDALARVCQTEAASIWRERGRRVWCGLDDSPLSAQRRSAYSGARHKLCAMGVGWWSAAPIISSTTSQGFDTGRDRDSQRPWCRACRRIWTLKQWYEHAAGLAGQGVVTSRRGEMVLFERGDEAESKLTSVSLSTVIAEMSFWRKAHQAVCTSCLGTRIRTVPEQPGSVDARPAAQDTRRAHAVKHRCPCRVREERTSLQQLAERAAGRNGLRYHSPGRAMITGASGPEPSQGAPYLSESRILLSGLCLCGS